MRVRAPTAVSPATTTWDSSLTPSPRRTRGPTWQNGPISTPSLSAAPGSTQELAWIKLT